MEVATPKPSSGRKLSVIMWVGGPAERKVSCELETSASEAASTERFPAILWGIVPDGLRDVGASDGPVLVVEVDSNAWVGVAAAASASRRSKRSRSFSPK